MKTVDIPDLEPGDLDNLNTVATVCDLLQSLALPGYILTLLQGVCGACYSLIPDPDPE